MTPERVEEIFSEYLPDHVTMVMVDHETFITHSLYNPFIQEQMRIGIYSQVNIWTDFLSIAKAYSSLGLVEIDMTLIEQQVVGLSDELSEVLIRWTAAHEAHHFESSHIPNGDPVRQAHAEKDCNSLVAAQYPELEQLMEQVEEKSPVYQRVYARIRAIQEARKT